jgi:formylglycine-generating enzyme required for sulfatase activity
MNRYKKAAQSGFCACLFGLVVLFGMSCERTSESENAAAPAVVKTRSGIEMVAIPAGSFEMGNNHGEDNEKPVHRVTLDAFLMDRYPVTQEQYEKLGLPNPAHFKGPAQPVEMISWTQAAAYCNARSRAEGLEPCYNDDTGDCNFQASGYRLPTEAEWEYACRAGTTQDYFFGNDARKLIEYAWFADNSAKKTHPVGEKKPNAWGLHDMVGNVAQWCNDPYDKDYYEKSPAENPHGPASGDKYVLRGGGWNAAAERCRSAARVGETPGFQDACFARDAIGFRCVKRAEETSVAHQSSGSGQGEAKVGGTGK